MTSVMSDFHAHTPIPLLEAPSQSLRFRRKQMLYHNGDPAQSVFRVRDGLVRITRDELGRPIVSATHELLAEGTASTRESVSKIITELRNEGLVESGYRSILIVDDEGLEVIAEGW